jgi:hypothetical protein
VSGDAEQSKANASLDEDERGEVEALEHDNGMSCVDKLLRGQVDVSDTNACVASVHDANACAKEQNLCNVSCCEHV